MKIPRTQQNILSQKSTKDISYIIKICNDFSIKRYRFHCQFYSPILYSSFVYIYRVLFTFEILSKIKNITDTKIEFLCAKFEIWIHKLDLKLCIQISSEEYKQDFRDHSSCTNIFHVYFQCMQYTHMAYKVNAFNTSTKVKNEFLFHELKITIKILTFKVSLWEWRRWSVWEWWSNDYWDFLKLAKLSNYAIWINYG